MLYADWLLLLGSWRQMLITARRSFAGDQPSGRAVLRCRRRIRRLGRRDPDLRLSRVLHRTRPARTNSWPCANPKSTDDGVACMTIAVFTLSLLGAMALGMPIAFALIVCGVALMHSLDIFDSQIVAQNIINGADSFPLMAVPFFMLAGEIMNTGGLARRIVNVALAFVGHVSGGLGYVAILAACILSSLSGSAVADAAALAALLVPMMIAAGHSKAHVRRPGRGGRHHRAGHSAEHRVRVVRRGGRRVDHRSCSSPAFFPGFCSALACAVAWWWVAQRRNRLAAARVLACRCCARSSTASGR